MDLFEEFCMIKDIKMHEAEPGKQFKTAVIEFFSQKDYLQFHECFQGCVYFDLALEVKPVFAHNPNQVLPQQYIDFTWFVWQSCRKALVQFE